MRRFSDTLTNTDSCYLALLLLDFFTTATVTIQTSRNFIFLEFIYDRVNKAKVGLTDHLGGQGKW